MFCFVPSQLSITVEAKLNAMKPSISKESVRTKKYKTNREEYLQGILKLNHDPFLHPSAEKELQIKPEDPPFFSYFVETPYQDEDELLLDKLKAPGTAVVYGQSGSGKTTLRYMLEWLCRAIPEQTLVISYNIGKGEPFNLNTTDRWNKLAEELAIDLFIQVLEQFNTLRPDKDPEFAQVFGLYWQQYIPNFKRTIDVSLARYRKEEVRTKKEEALALKRVAQREVKPHTQAKEPGVFVGVSADMSKWWQVWDRPVVRYTSLSPDILIFLRKVLTVKGENNEKEAGRGAVAQGVQLARQLGYKSAFLLVDVVGTLSEDELDIESLMSFLGKLDSFQLPIEYKLFLPDTFETAVIQCFAANRLTPPQFSAIIEWNNPEAFNKLISNRLQRASKWIRKLDTLMNPEVAAQFKNMTEENGRTPRQVLQTISYLIDAHVRQNIDNYQITLDDWERMQQDWTIRE